MDKRKLYISIIIILIALIIILGIVFFVKLYEVEKKSSLTPLISPEEVYKEKPVEKEIYLYFSTEDGEHLAKEVRKIKTIPKELPRRVFDELKKGPHTKGLYIVFGENIKLRDIYISGNVGFVDFSDSLLSMGMGTTEELLFIYSIVNSLCFSLNLSKIKFLVNGEEIDTFGHIDISNPIYPNYDILKK